MGAAAEAINYDYDVIDTPTETSTTDKIVQPLKMQKKLY